MMNHDDIVEQNKNDRMLSGSDQENEEFADFGTQAKESIAKRDPMPHAVRASIAKAAFWGLIGTYIIFSVTYIVSDPSKMAENAKDVWGHISQFSTNALMLVLGYYFSKKDN